MGDYRNNIRENYDVDSNGDFYTTNEFIRAQENGDIDSNGYDNHGNHYNQWGNRDYDSGFDGGYDSSDEK